MTDYIGYYGTAYAENRSELEDRPDLKMGAEYSPGYAVVAVSKPRWSPYLQQWCIDFNTAPKPKAKRAKGAAA